jgi:putative MATE family efflux protein
MAYPVMIGSVAITVLNVTDTVFLGRVGEVELGASGLAGVFYFVMAMIGVAIGIGTQIQIARRAGEKNEGAIGEIFDHSVFIFLALGAIEFVILKFFSASIFSRIIESEEVQVACVEFLKYRSFGIFFLMLATAFRSFYVGIATPKVYGYYSALIASINVLLAYALIFGHFGAPKMGIAGAGLASSIAEFIGIIFLFAYAKWRNDILKFKLFRFESFKSALISKTLVLSTPLVMQNLISMGAWFIFFVFIEKLGKHALAVSNITRSVYMIEMTPMWGFAVAANSMVSNIIGQGRRDEVVTLVNRIIKMATAIGLIMIAINFLMPYQLMSLFTSDQQLIDDSFGCLQIIGIAMFVFPFSIVCISAVSGTGATKSALYIEVAAIIIYMSYLVITVFQLKTSVEIAWLAEAIYWLFTGVVSYMFIKSHRWKKISL